VEKRSDIKETEVINTVVHETTYTGQGDRPVHRSSDRNCGDMTEYEYEDPEIRREFEEECRKNG